MPKSFKKFREDEWDDEWGNDEDDDRQRKEHKFKKRRNQRLRKVNEKYAGFDLSDIDD